MANTVSFTVAVFYETRRLKASLQCQIFLGSIICWNYGEGDLVKRLVTRWRADGARVWSRDCYLVHPNPLLQFLLLPLLLLLLLLFLPPWQIGAVDKLELSTSDLRQQQAATRLRCEQIRLTRDLAAQSTGLRIIRPGRDETQDSENTSASSSTSVQPLLWLNVLPAWSQQHIDVPIFWHRLYHAELMYETNNKKHSFVCFESLKGLWEHGHTHISSRNLISVEDNLILFIKDI